MKRKLLSISNHRKFSNESYHAIKWLKELPLINRFHAAKDYEAYVHIDIDAISRCEKFNKPSVVIKDIFVVDGMPTQAGCMLPSNIFPTEEFPLIQRLRDAGYEITAKATTTEFACYKPSKCLNPIDTKYSPGGSSSGSATCVALHLCDIGVGSQTVGSTIRPAAFCGVFGWKPSASRLPLSKGVISFAPSLDQIGFFARSVTELQSLATNIIPDWNPHEVELPLRLCAIEGPYLEQASNLSQELFEKDLSLLKEKDIDIVRVSAFENIDDINHHHNTIIFYEAARYHQKWIEQYRDLYSEMFLQLVEPGLKITDDEYEESMAFRDEFEKSLMQILGDCSAFVSPSTINGAPPKLEEGSTGSPNMSIPWTHSKWPNIAIPTWTSKLPSSIQLICPRDEQLLSLAKACS